MNLKTFLDQESVIIGVTNHIGKINVQEFQKFEVLENSFENWMKHYRDTTDYHARNTSMEDNDIDSLRAMWLHTRQDIRQFDQKPKKKQEDNDLTKEIHDFFIINEDGKKWSFQG